MLNLRQRGSSNCHDLSLNRTSTVKAAQPLSVKTLSVDEAARGEDEEHHSARALVMGRGEQPSHDGS